MARIGRKTWSLLKYQLLHGALEAGRVLHRSRAPAYEHLVSFAAGSIWPLRRRVRTNMELALGRDNVPAGSVDAYFRLLGRWSSLIPRVYHHGLAATGIADRVRFDESCDRAEEVVAGGRGAVLAIPHLFGHEVVVGVVHRRYGARNERYRGVALVRGSTNKRHMEVKRRWYEDVLNGEVVIRRAHTSPLSDLRACVRVLRSGKVFVITPDLVARHGDGVSVRVFDRPVTLRAGAAALAMFGKAPLIGVFFDWLDDHIAVRCTEPIEVMREGDLEQSQADAMQKWCDAFEAHLRQFPAGWMFWLDKRWTRVLRSSSGENGAA